MATPRWEELVGMMPFPQGPSLPSSSGSKHCCYKLLGGHPEGPLPSAHLWDKITLNELVGVCLAHNKWRPPHCWGPADLGCYPWAGLPSLLPPQRLGASLLAQAGTQGWPPAEPVPHRERGLLPGQCLAVSFQCAC